MLRADQAELQDKLRTAEADKADVETELAQMRDQVRLICDQQVTNY